jgi:hypothetical protein
MGDIGDRFFERRDDLVQSRKPPIDL